MYRRKVGEKIEGSEMYDRRVGKNLIDKVKRECGSMESSFMGSVRNIILGNGYVENL